jgi:alcohol dehydrogenase class IV
MVFFNFYQPTRIHFGAGRIKEIGKICAKYGDTCLLVTTSKDEAVLRPLYDRVKTYLTEVGLRVIHFDEVIPNPVIEGIEKAITIVHREKVSVILGLGGGSSIDTAKSISLFHGGEKINWQEVFGRYTDPFTEYELPGSKPLPVIAVPTTAGTGSELTQAMVISDPAHDDKECIFHDKIFPTEALIDVELMQTLPSYLTAITGFDAFSHSFESFLREHASPYTQLIGLKAMSLIIEALPALVKDPGNISLREQMGLAEMFGGISLCNAAASMPHPLSEIIGGISPRIPHGQCLACIYPRFLDYITPRIPDRCAVIARLFDPTLISVTDTEAASKLPGIMRDFLETIGIGKNFSQCGLTEAEMDQAANHFLLGVLPFASKDIMAGILRDSF